MTQRLDGWDIGSATDRDWVDWGEGGAARAKLLAAGDGYVVALVETEPGYTGGRHDHVHTEFLYVLEGRLRNQGEVMETGDAYVAAAGSTHTDFVTESASTYLSIFKI
jgi:quercetin dioxygenase-like cupin family protein